MMMRRSVQMFTVTVQLVQGVLSLGTYLIEEALVTCLRTVGDRAERWPLRLAALVLLVVCLRQVAMGFFGLFTLIKNVLRVALFLVHLAGVTLPAGVLPLLGGGLLILFLALTPYAIFRGFQFGRAIEDRAYAPDPLLVSAQSPQQS